MLQKPIQMYIKTPRLIWHLKNGNQYKLFLCSINGIKIKMPPTRNCSRTTTIPTENGNETPKELNNERLLYRILDIVKSFEHQHVAKGQKVLNYVDPSEISNALGGLEISKDGTTIESAAHLVDNVMQYSVKTGHPHFYNALYHGVDSFGMAGGLVSEALNTNCYSHEVAPVFSAVEIALVKYFGTKFGWDHVDGLTAPGGSIANM